ncbi:MAG: putative zinc-binding carboxypeptidase [uncultured Solirubrobacteraceae bacterium]|uniref:Putative zinc-binding carboxypeptidase n=1 Tax=uncultured Solirubrobacteraceae bacterium TaxID=1162706 RepID=A0A6J4T866_9ACTN|nr:MAG: putative zinc-binding carboxypeptidase [uncultured Solirubrobacteraceae bacterium]
MRSATLGVAVAVLAALVASSPAPAAAKTTEVLQQFVVSGKGADPEALARAGYDMREAHREKGDGYLIVATPSQAAKLEGKDVSVQPLAAKQADAKVTAPNPLQDPTHGYDVFRPWNLNPAPCPTVCSTPRLPLRKWYLQQASANADVVERVPYGRSRLGQQLAAFRVTKGASSTPQGSRPVVLYHATQHAREWIAVETNRRLFDYVLKHKNDPASGIPQLLATTELWFTPVVNPDGYDYTFVADSTRMWRKTLRDNNGDGAITVGDGVDPNRNWPTKWRFDPEGASDNPASETYRGPSPGSEPEVSAYRALMNRLKAKFMIDYHSHGELILYPEGWQVETRATDDPIMEALAGRDENNPAIPGYDPDLSAELYTVNGDITDDALHVDGTQAYTVELTAGFGPPVGGTDGGHPNRKPGGFAFQDSEVDVQNVFEENLEFALDLARSAPDPDDPKSHIGNEATELVPNTFAVSHGDPQLLEVNAKQALGAVTAHWQVAGGGSGSAPMSEWDGGLRYGAPGTYYHHMRAKVTTGATPGQQVEVWFTAGGEESAHFTYTLASDTGRRVLLLVAEDYLGNSGFLPKSTAPYFKTTYEQALTDAGIAHDVYDVDARGRTAPSAVGVLSHYDAVIWETGGDLYTREGNQPGGTGVSKLLDDEVLAARDYMNAGGKVLIAGKEPLQGVRDQFLYNPDQGRTGAPWCKSNQTTGQNDADDPVGQQNNCIAISNDFLQYWLGAYVPAGAALNEQMKEDPSIGDTLFGLNGPGSVSNAPLLQSFLTTTSLISTYPAFAAGTEFGSDRAIAFDRKPSFDPPTGDWYMSSGSANYAYKRLTRTVDLTNREAAELAFKVSFDTEAQYDFVFVEARSVGGSDWKTLPDANGHTGTSVGAGCTESSDYWLSTHPHLREYIVRSATPTTPGGSTYACGPKSPGSWNAASGNSAGYQDWRVALNNADFGGDQIEVSIVYQTDPGTLGLGSWVDDASITSDGETLSQTSFEDGLGGWTVPGALPGSQGNANDWERAQSIGLVDGPGVRTGHSIMWGFGLEAVDGADKRAALLRNAMRYFDALE